MTKYPKRGDDCEYTMDCMWGVDGWCDRPADMKCELAQMDERIKKEQREDALNRLVKLGDMMGDGLHHEPDGKWIEKEYRKAMREAGLIKPAPKDTAAIDAFMETRTKEERCPCGGDLRQTRKGSLRAKCAKCEKVFQLGQKQKRR